MSESPKSGLDVLEARGALQPSSENERPRLRPENIRAVRLGHGANCSSVGSVIDTLFLTSAVGGALFAALAAALSAKKEEEETNLEEDEA